MRVIATLLVLLSPIVGSHASAEATGKQQVVVTGSDDPHDGRCSAREVGQLVADFLTAQDLGTARLSEFVAPRPRFRWYTDSVSKKRVTLAEGKKRSTLGAYLANRHRLDDRLSLSQLALSVAGGVGNFDYILDRTAQDIPVGLPVTTGKGAVDCRTGLVFVWSMGFPVAAARGNLCPDASAVAPGTAIACGRAP